MPEETVRIMCPKLTCRKILVVPVSSRGKTVRCKNCSTTIRVPAKQAPAAAPVEPPSSEERAA
jgi:predicted Zn finger-like uncharacterized protein